MIKEDLEKLCRIVRDGMSKALDNKGINEAKKASEDDDAKVLFFACTIWSGLLDKVEENVSAKILDPVKTAVIFAEMLAKNWIPNLNYCTSLNYL